jgi:hypothetical protein
MIRSFMLFMGLALLSLVLAAPSWGQSGQKPGGSPGNLYNPHTVVTVSGIVVAKTPPAAKGLPQLVYLTLKTATGKIIVFLGPDLYVDKLPVQIQALDKIQVRGSRITWKGQPVIIAATIQRGNQVLKLREPNGIPVWGGRRRH